jgi:hypothetical protein
MPLFTLAIRSEDERAFTCTYQDSYATHFLFSLPDIGLPAMIFMLKNYHIVE